MIDLTAPIQDVTVYADRALVTRRGSIQLEAGEHELRVNDLPQFISESLRASGQGPQGTRILNVDITTAFYSRPPEAELQALQDALEKLAQQKQLLQAGQDALKERQQWLRALGEQSRAFATGLARGQMKPQDCGDFFSFMTTQTIEDAKAAQALDLEEQHVQKEIDARKRELQQKKGYTKPDRLAATVAISIAEAGTFELELSYLITNASWRPQYDVRVQMDEQQSSGTVEVTYLGMVQQATGERWENVSLSLSTARPSLAATLPELTPWYLNVYAPLPPPMATMSYGGPSGAVSPSPQAAPMKSRMRKIGATSTHMDDEEFKEELLPISAEVATAEVEHTGTALVFRVGRSVDIPSDNSAHKTTIALDNLPCTFDYVSAPAIEEYTHLRATVTNTTEHVLLKGQASIFLSGEYVGTTSVETTATSEKFKIFLGIDDKIKIKREPSERSVDRGNLLKNDQRLSTYGYRITVHNYAQVARTIVIRDRLPVPQHERIKVKIQQMQPQPAEHTKLELLTWEFTLGANAEQKIDYRFVVEHPQGLQVTGLPQ